MHAAMSELNRTTEVVLQAARSGGWLAYRPDQTGRLQHADRELWAQCHPDCGGRVTKDQLSRRFDWLDSTGKPTMAGDRPTDWRKEAEEMAEGRSKNYDEVEADYLSLETDPKAIFDDSQSYEASLLAVLHPRHRLQSDIQKQIEGLGWYQREQAKLAGKAGATPKKLPRYLGNNPSGAKRKKRVRALRADLAAKFSTNLKNAGSAVKRLSDLIPKISKKKKGKNLSAAKKKRKNKQNSKRKLQGLSKLAKSQACAIKNSKHAKKDLAAASSAEAAAEVVLGSSGGPLEGKQVRLVAPGLSELLRNSAGTVDSHYLDTGLLAVATTSGSIRTFPEGDCWVLTGKEVLPMPEKTPKMTTCSKALLLTALADCGGAVDPTVKAADCLSDEHVMAGFHDMGFRALSTAKGDVWPNPLIVCLDPACLRQWLHDWNHSPGWPDSQANLQTCRNAMGAFLVQKSAAGFVSVPICAGGHWSLLLLNRQCPAPDQADHNKIELIYKDSLNPPSKTCRAQAELALSFLIEVVGQSELAQRSLPACSPSSKQKDNHSCGFFCLNFMEEQYRLWRGEGRRILTEKFQDKAADLTRFCKSLMTVHHAEMKKAAVAKALAAPSPPPLADAPAAAPVSTAIVALPSGPAEPLADQEKFGCTKCRYAPTGCRACNPVKMARAAAKAKAKESAEADSQAASSTDKWSALACPPAARKRKLPETFS